MVQVLDVGHGNCAVVSSCNTHAVIDSPLGGFLLKVLKKMGISRLHALVVSHSDRDHIAGVLAVLTDPEIVVEKIYVNPDGPKRTKIWGDLLAALRIAEIDDQTEVINSLTSKVPGGFKIGDLNLDILGPTASLAIAGVGGRDTSGRRITSNSLSALIKVCGPKGASLLLAGDTDLVGLEPLLDQGVDMESDVLVYPHHGGFSGDRENEHKFISKLLNNVKPSKVIFSNGHGVHDNPKPHVIESVTSTGCRIACTQLSKRCCSDPNNLPQNRSDIVMSKGATTRTSCAGTMIFDLSTEANPLQTLEAEHSEFVQNIVPSPLCVQ